MYNLYHMLSLNQSGMFIKNQNLTYLDLSVDVSTFNMAYVLVEYGLANQVHPVYWVTDYLIFA